MLFTCLGKITMEIDRNTRTRKYGPVVPVAKIISFSKLKTSIQWFTLAL